MATKDVWHTGVRLAPSHSRQPVGIVADVPDHAIITPDGIMPPAIHAPVKNGDAVDGTICPKKPALHVQPAATDDPALLAGHATTVLVSEMQYRDKPAHVPEYPPAIAVMAPENPVT